MVRVNEAEIYLLEVLKKIKDKKQDVA